MAARTGQSRGFSFDEGITTPQLTPEKILSILPVEKAVIRDLLYFPADETAWEYARRTLFPFHFMDGTAAVIFDSAMMLRESFEDHGFVGVKTLFAHEENRVVVDWLDALILLNESQKIASITKGIFSIRAAWHQRRYDQFLRERPTLTDEQITAAVSELERFGKIKFEARKLEVLKNEKSF
ncbi:hypothetical protein QQ056_05615 [Oscillatoria laete-virens NRMC-F 0139]|nr:hypothetical protein [Oscillatoria laete-virens]MDL5053029.1 hypothetical protein [Oscillatoria laete-virens NRMC-F 0139]